MDRSKDHAQLASLDAAYWERADERSTAPASDLFADEGSLVVGSVTLGGREKVERFFRDRAEQHAKAQRHTRHFSSGLRVEFTDENSAQMTSVVMVFAGLGSIPLDSSVPSTIADVQDVCVKDQAGQWKFRSRTITPVFVGAGAAKFARK